MRAEPNHAPAKRGATRCSGHVQLGRLPLAAPGDRERNTPRSFPTHKPERIDIDGEPGGRLPRAATPPLAGATFGRSRRLDALFLPPWRLGTSRALARSRTAGPRLAADARRGLPRTAGRANARGELLRRARRARARLLARARACRTTGCARSLPALLRGSPGCARSHLCRRRRSRLRTARRCLYRAARPRRRGCRRPAPSAPPDARERGRGTRLPLAAHAGSAARDRARHAAQDRGRSATGLALRSGLGPAAASLGAALRPPGRAARGGGGRGPPARPRTGEAARPPERRRARALLAATARRRRAACVLAPLAGRAAARLGRKRSAGEHRLPRRGARALPVRRPGLPLRRSLHRGPAPAAPDQTP